MGNNVQAGYDTSRDIITDQVLRQRRDEQARQKLAAFAVDQPDPKAWLVDMLDYLGLWPDGDRQTREVGHCADCGRLLPLTSSVRCWACRHAPAPAEVGGAG